MTIPTYKQKIIITLAQQGLSIPEISKETSTSYKTAKKYAGISTTPQPQIPAPQQSVIDGRSPMPAIPVYDTQEPYVPPHSSGQFTDSDIEQMYEYYNREEHKHQRDGARQHRLESNDGYERPIPRVEHVPVDPRQQAFDEQLEDFYQVHSRTGIPLTRPQAEVISSSPTFEEIEAGKRRTHHKKMLNLRWGLIEIEANVRKAKEEALNEQEDTNNGQKLTEAGIRNAIQEATTVDTEKQQKISDAYTSLSSTVNNEIYRVKRKKINDKFLADVAPSVLGFVGDVVKSFVIVSKIPKSKPKIVMAQLVKEPMQARVIK
jgi:hypothetical protein